MSTVIRWAIAFLVALAIGLSWQLDAPKDHQADWGNSQALKDLQAAEAGSAHQQMAAAELCLQVRGPNSEARWLKDGSLACTTRRGLVTAKAQP